MDTKTWLESSTYCTCIILINKKDMSHENLDRKDQDTGQSACFVYRRLSNVCRIKLFGKPNVTSKEL